MEWNSLLSKRNAEMMTLMNDERNSFKRRNGERNWFETEKP